MIEIHGNDQPIEVAAKLITATVKIKASALDIVMARTAGREPKRKSMYESLISKS